MRFLLVLNEYSIILSDFHFSESDLAYLQEELGYKEDFINYLKDVRFTGDVYSMVEGELVFANEPIIRIEAPLVEAHLIETALLKYRQLPNVDCDKSEPNQTNRER